MNLIDRYLHEVGRYLPGKNREDILAEIRSHLTDTLEARVQGEPTEEDVSSLLKETGSPRKLAASYPGGEGYLVGPELYPFFRMVTGIVLASVIGAQLLAVGVGLWMGEETFHIWEVLEQLLMSVPVSIGFVVIVFRILQWRGVYPKIEEENWDPKTLPMVNEDETVKKGEKIFGIAAGSIILALLAAFSDRIGIIIFPGGVFYPNPVVQQMLPWVSISLLASIGLDIYLLWQGRWNLGSRIANIAVNLISVIVLVLLVLGHIAWLSAHGSSGFFTTLENLSLETPGSIQNMIMAAFNLAFVVALTVTWIETIVLLIKLFRGMVKKDTLPVIMEK